MAHSNKNGSQMDIDHYIDWDNARQMLIDVIKQANHSVNLCDAVLVREMAYESNNGGLAAFLKSIDVTDEQVEQLSRTYLSMVGTLKMIVQQLGNNEINETISGETSDG